MMHHLLLHFIDLMCEIQLKKRDNLDQNGSPQIHPNGLVPMVDMLYSVSMVKHCELGTGDEIGGKFVESEMEGASYLQSSCQ